jgi:hypothetical protein
VEKCILILSNSAGELHTNKGQIYQIHALIMHLGILENSKDYNEY